MMTGGKIDGGPMAGECARPVFMVIGGVVAAGARIPGGPARGYASNYKHHPNGTGEYEASRGNRHPKRAALSFSSRRPA